MYKNSFLEAPGQPETKGLGCRRPHNEGPKLCVRKLSKRMCVPRERDRERGREVQKSIVCFGLSTSVG